MRVLFSCTAGVGHFFPLVPLARAFAQGGHEVAFATAEPAADAAAAAGFDVLPAGLGQTEIVPLLEQHRQRIQEIPPAERRPAAFVGRFGRVEGPAKVEPLLAVARAWRPDLIVHEAADLAGPLAAAALGIGSAVHSFGRIMPRVCYERAHEEVAPLWHAAGLEPEPLCGAYRGAYVDICPPSFATEGPPEGVPSYALRPEAGAGGESAPPWLAGLADPLVYVTLGTVFNDAEVIRVLLDGLSDLQGSVVATVGRNLDPAAFEPLPAHTRVERWLPQALVLDRAAVTIAHGGSGSTIAALARGVPLLLVPQGADQFENAGRCAELGTAIVLMPGEVTAESVRDGVAALLERSSYREASRRVAAEIAAMPAPEDVAAALVAAV